MCDDRQPPNEIREGRPNRQRKIIFEASFTAQRQAALGGLEETLV
jgi:hypothetical protein